jgi:hypothetical protein
MNTEAPLTQQMVVLRSQVAAALGVKELGLNRSSLLGATSSGGSFEELVLTLADILKDLFAFEHRSSTKRGPDRAKVHLRRAGKREPGRSLRKCGTAELRVYGSPRLRSYGVSRFHVGQMCVSVC